MRILMAKVRVPRAAQICVTSRCSQTQLLANCSRVAVSDLRSHFFLNQDVPPVHQAAIGHGVFRLQREETRRTWARNRRCLSCAMEESSTGLTKGEGAIGIPLRALSFIFNDLAFPCIPRMSLKFLTSLFRKPTTLSSVSANMRVGEYTEQPTLHGALGRSRFTVLSGGSFFSLAACFWFAFAFSESFFCWASMPSIRFCTSFMSWVI